MQRMNPDVIVCCVLCFLLLPACSLVLETKEVPDKCGDGVVQWWEACDDSNFKGETCLGLTGRKGILACSADCMRIDTTGCNAPETCGNGELDDGEDCDGDIVFENCESHGYGGGELACMSNCRFDFSGCSLCGNEVLDGEEECDDGNNMNGDGCSSDCIIEAGWNCQGTGWNSCEPICGDSILVSGEECDGEEFWMETTCEDYGYYGGEVTCSGMCELDFTSCQGRCGDGVIQPAFGEECDGTDFLPAGVNCGFLGYKQGPLECSPDCGLDFSQCMVRDEAVHAAMMFVETGDHHTCAHGIMNHPLICWGNSVYGQVGVQPSAGNWFPGPSMARNSIYLAKTGAHHTCALVEETGLYRPYCWGRNDTGQLGNQFEDNVMLATSAAARVSFPPGIAADQITAGRAHTCALVQTQGTAWCWGSNDRGQSGLDPNMSQFSRTPVEISGHVFSEISAGGRHTCGITRESQPRVYCWGGNELGQLGGVGGTLHHVPQLVTGIGTTDYPAQIHAGENHTCVNTSGGLVCWGDNSAGQIGQGVAGGQRGPTYVPIPAGAVMTMSAGGNTTCIAVMTESGFLCWGDNQFGQLGVGDTLNRSTPTPVFLDLDLHVDHVSVSSGHVCAVVSRPVPVERIVYCWGRNDFGQLGDKSRNDSFLPIPINLD